MRLKICKKGKDADFVVTYVAKRKKISHLNNKYVVGILLHQTTFLLSCFENSCSR